MRWNSSRRDFCSFLAGAGLGFAFPASETARSSPRFKLGIITDELTEDLEQALEFISKHDLSFCELREIWQKNIMNLSQEELGRAKRLLERYRLRVTDIGSPLFKYNLPGMPAREESRDTFRANFTDQHTETLLRKAFELAEFFGTSKVRVFSYWRVEQPERAYAHVRERLAKAAALAARQRVVLVLENEPSCNIGTGKELGRLLRDVNSAHLRGNWDPGNAAVLDEIPYPDGYREVRGLFSHMHLKDVRKDPHTGKFSWAPVGSGLIDYRGQFQALLRDRYTGTMSLETHYRRADGNSVESTRESLEGLLRVLREVA